MDRRSIGRFLLKMAARAGVIAGDVIAFGHTHKPWHRMVQGIHFVNARSIGRPKDGDWRAGYVLLDVSERVVTIEFVRVRYDLERAMRGIRESELPDEFAEYLQAGGRSPAVSLLYYRARSLRFRQSYAVGARRTG